MNRAFKILFHNGYADEKPIVIMSVRVNNGKRFHALDNEGKDNLVINLVRFKQWVEEFTAEIIKSIREPLPNSDKTILIEKIAEQEIEIASLKNKVKELQSDYMAVQTEIQSNENH